MKMVCDEKVVARLVPIIDVKTRWNSTNDMLHRAVSMKDIIADTIYAHRDNRLIILLCDADWLAVRSLLDVLEPLKEMTLLASRRSENLCVVDVIPMYNHCAEMLPEN